MAVTINEYLLPDRDRRIFERIGALEKNRVDVLVFRHTPRLWAAKMNIFQFIEHWYNPHRRHSAIDYLSPMEYERRHMALAS